MHWEYLINSKIHHSSLVHWFIMVDVQPNLLMHLNNSQVTILYECRLDSDFSELSTVINLRLFGNVGSKGVKGIRP